MIALRPPLENDPSALGPDLPVIAGAPVGPPVLKPRERRIDGDLAAARQVQRALLPPLDQQFQGVEVAAEYRPAYEIGGDLLEVARADGRISFVVGDVAGNGVTAALLMAWVSAEVRRFTAAGRRPSRILAGVNRWLDRQGLPDRFVTATAIELDLDRARWTAANAGHPPALLFRKDGRVLMLAEAGGPGLGFGGLARWHCADQVVPAEVDDILLVLTDGIVDRVPPAEIVALVTAAGPGWPCPLPLAELRRRLLERLAAAPGEPDDATLLAVRVTAAALGTAC